MPALLRELKKFYAHSARAHLPWRATHDPYRILVSEVMLQQTQVDRVAPYYARFIKKFPTAKKLAQASLAEVLGEWQGLGYNRRGKFLWEASKQIAAVGVPKKGVGVVFISPFLGTSRQLSTDFLETLPGVGPYTARAIATFAYNRTEVFIETNIRTVFFFHFYSGVLQKTRIDDKELLLMVAEALKKSKMQPREFYAALMDYGSHLKSQGVRLNSKSRHYAKQSKFKGSARELRGALLRELLKGPKTSAQLRKDLSRKKGEVDVELARLAREGMIKRQGSRLAVA